MANASYAQLFVMAAIVATLFLAPVAGMVWLVSLMIGVPFELLVTVGGRFGHLTGLALWWSTLFVGALVYAASLRKAS
jgi:hypothetical protein